MNDIGLEGAAASTRPARSVHARRRAALACGVAAIVLTAALGAADAAVPAVTAKKPGKAAVRQAAKDAPKPLHVPIIAISIGSQRVTVFEKGQPVASAPVSTGTPSHPTPTGIFSVIQKHKVHYSNLYGAAPMPYMQRITWSGVALHAGPLPGFPASHGCIRLPHDFAVKLWSMTRMGARVIVSRNDVVPHEFSHPRLFVLKKSPEVSELRPSVLVAEGEGPFVSDAVSAVARTLSVLAKPAEAPAREPAVTSAEPPAKIVPHVEPAKAAEAPAAAETPTEPAAPVLAPAEPTKAVEAPAEPPKTVEAPAEPAPAVVAAPPVETPASAVVAAPAKAPEPAEVDIPELRTGTVKPAQMTAPAAIAAEPPAAAEPPKAAEAPAPAEPPQSAETPVIDAPKVVEKPLRPGPVSVFVSRKEGKLYVRKGFEPLFEAPVVIARADTAIGTHVYTASELLDDGANFRWLVVSMHTTAPRAVDARRGARKAAADKAAKVVKVAKAPTLLPPPATAAEALDRVEFSDDVVERISQMMSPGASLIISDQGLGYETGKETDFIVVTR